MNEHQHPDLLDEEESRQMGLRMRKTDEDPSVGELCESCGSIHLELQEGSIFTLWCSWCGQLS